MTCTHPCSCCKGACCNAGICTQETCEDCEAAGGEWVGPGSQCGDGDCSLGCCEEDATCPDRTVYRCRLDFYGECSGIAPATVCDATGQDIPDSGNLWCDGGTPTTVTVTGSAFTHPDSAVEACFNSAYAVDLNCDGEGLDTFTCGIYEMEVVVYVKDTVTVDMALRYLGTLVDATSGFVALTLSYTSPCSYGVYDCSPQTITPSSYYLSLAAGSIDVS